MNRSATTALLLFAILLAGFTVLVGSSVKAKHLLGNQPAHLTSSNPVYKKLQNKAQEVKSFTSKKNYNRDICFLIDMSLSSGKKRFFVYSMGKDSILTSGLVTHGRCNQWWLDGRRYSNTAGSGCTSLGKYKIGVAYQGRFGLAYKLYGLDSTNSQAYQRCVVLHSHQCVPEGETANEICQSDGCPTVSPQFLQQLKPFISSGCKPVLLWIFE